MIKINLLKARKEQKKIKVRKEMIVFILSMAAVLAVVFGASGSSEVRKRRSRRSLVRKKRLSIINP
jgi:hypothetical protein